MDGYEYTDKVLRTVNRQLALLASRNRSLYKGDQLHIITQTRQIYREVVVIAVTAFKRIAKAYYDDIIEEEEELEDLELIFGQETFWVDAFLEDPNPTTRLSFTREMERRQGKLAEALAVSPTKREDYDRAFRQMANLIGTYAVLVTDEARIRAMEDADIDKVEWLTAQDRRVCDVCRERDKKVYHVDHIPPKPHAFCRCWLKPLGQRSR